MVGKSTIKTREPSVCLVSGNNLNLHYCTMQFSVSAHTYHTQFHMGRKTDLRGRKKIVKIYSLPFYWKFIIEIQKYYL